jgi:hypothetical protein
MDYKGFQGDITSSCFPDEAAGARVFGKSAIVLANHENANV